MSEINKGLDIIGIGGNDAPPNPRIPVYVIDNLKNNVTDILLTSSKDSAIKNQDTEEGRILTDFNTYQKIKLIKYFSKYFYPDQKITIDFSENTNHINDIQWLELWKEIEARMRDGEKEEVYNILQNYNRTGNVEKGKIYSARHPFWFKDLSLKGEDKSLEGYDKINTYGGKQEGFFNFIRDKSIQIPHKKLKDIFGEDITKNKINKIITSGHYSKVVPYGEGTTGKNKSKRSIEYPIGDINQTYDQEYKKGNIKEHYEQKRQKKAGFNYDIEKIISNVNGDVYQEFINNFSKGYKQDLRNI